MNHPMIQFKPIIAPGLPLKSVRGVLVGRYLVVSFAGEDAKSGYAIYNTLGRRLFRATYPTYDRAIAQAEFIDKTYGEFLPIWEEFPGVDVFWWARWSIADGHRIYEQLQRY